MVNVNSGAPRSQRVTQDRRRKTDERATDRTHELWIRRLARLFAFKILPVNYVRDLWC